jgi:CRISPR-associated endonuclease/helicase Cas3
MLHFKVRNVGYQLNIPDYQAIRSSDSLYSRLVVIKGYQDPTTFTEAVQRQMDSLEIQGKVKVLTRRDGTPQKRQLTLNPSQVYIKLRI